MNNAQILRALPKIDEKKKRRSEKMAQVKRLARDIEKLEEQIDILEDVNEVYDGVAIKIYKYGHITIKAVDYDSISRCAEVYRNAHNGWTWGLHTYTDTYGRKGKEWHGAQYPDYDEVIKFAKDWVVHGKLPKYQAFRSLEAVLCD